MSSDHRTGSADAVSVGVVPGEMQPWTDRHPTGGPVLCGLLADALPSSAQRALVLGPHGPEVVDLLAGRADEVTVLVRSVSDASELAARVSDGSGGTVRVVAGGLDGLSASPFDVVVAADGLDRLLGADSPDLDWPQRLRLLAGLTTPDAVVVVALANEFSLTALLDRRPPGRRHGDDQWRPLRDDPDRPVSVTQFGTALTAAGLDPGRIYANYSADGVPHTLLEVAAAESTRPGRLAARLAVHALESDALGRPLLAPVADGAEAAARAGLLGSVASGWLAAVRPAAGHTLYARSPADAVLTADATAARWTTGLTSTPTLTPAASGGPGGSAGSGGSGAGGGALAARPELVPAGVPDGESVEQALLRLAAAEDVPGFRALAARLGDWARAQAPAECPALLLWDDLTFDGEDIARGVSPWAAAAPAGATDLLVAAWQRFHDRLLGRHHRHPWPVWMAGDRLVLAWLAMSGEELADDSAAALARGRELAAALDAAAGPASTASTASAPSARSVPEVAGTAGNQAAERELRTALAEAERARREVFELAGQIAGLERTLGFRDKQLRVREDRIRSLRADRDRVRNSRTFKAGRVVRGATVVRHPRQFARTVKRYLDRRRWQRASDRALR